MKTRVFTSLVEQDNHRGALQQAINTSIRARIRGDENRIKSPCLSVGWAKNMQSLLGYAFGNTRDFLQIYLAMPSLLPKVNLDMHLVLAAAWSRATRRLFDHSRPWYFQMRVLHRVEPMRVVFNLHLCVFFVVESE